MPNQFFCFYRLIRDFDILFFEDILPFYKVVDD